MARNPHSQQFDTPDSQGGYGLENIKNVKTIERILPDGTRQVIEIHCRQMFQDANGVNFETENQPVVYDICGNPIPTDQAARQKISHTGMIIPTEAEHGICTSRFHRNPNRNVYLGCDGVRITDKICFCAHCYKIDRIIVAVLWLLGVSAGVGMLMAVWNL